MTCHQASEVLELYSLGVLDPDEAAEVRDHLATGCHACNAGLRRGSLLNAVILGSVPDIAPSPTLRCRIQALSAPPRTPVRTWAAVGLAAALGVAAVWFASLWQESREETAEAFRQRDAIRAQADRANAALAFLRNPETRPASAVSPSRQPSGTYYVNPQGGVLLIASNLPRLSPDKTYQMWIIPRGRPPQPGGLFRPDDGGGAIHLNEVSVDPGDVQALAITVEPASGSAAPTTTPMLVQPVAE